MQPSLVSADWKLKLWPRSVLGPEEGSKFNIGVNREMLENPLNSHATIYSTIQKISLKYRKTTL